MVDHIHFPKRVGPLFPTERIKKVKRRKDRKQDAGFKEDLEKEKQQSESEDENEEGSDTRRKRAAADRMPGRDGSEGTPASTRKKKTSAETAAEKRIDVHA
jgi:hypothetical protein